MSNDGQIENTSALTFRQSTNNKTLGQYYVMKNYIDPGLVEISY